MDHHRKQEAVLGHGRIAEDGFAQFQVTTGGNGQEFRKPLNDPQDKGIYRFQLAVFLWVGVQQYGVYFYPQAKKHQGGCQAYPPETKNIRIKYVGVVASATTHQNKTQGHAHKPDKHEQVIFFLEDKLLFRPLILGAVLFFTHMAKLVI